MKHQGLVGFFLVLLLSCSVVVLIAKVSAGPQKGEHTDPSTRYNKEGELVKFETDYDANGRIVEEREFYKSGKLRKRIKRTYLKGFKDPNISSTEYWPDGTTPQSTTNSDHDKDGNRTSTVTTNYDAQGKEISGTKREHGKDGKDHCFKWNPKTQAYEEVDCGTLGSFFDVFHYLEGPPPTKARVELEPGLLKVSFSTPNGQVIVNLPDDITAGDTVSGTVTEEPKGRTAQEKEKNKDTLDGLVIDLEGTKVPANQPHFIWLPPMPQPGLMPPRYQLKIVEILKGETQEHVYSNVFIETFEWPKVTTGPQKDLVETTLPLLGQTGRPSQISGPFDGNSNNTTVKIGGQSITPLAESPRQVVFQSPTNVIGPVEISVKEGDKETKGTFRNVGINLSAPKTSLTKGERTTLTVTVEGLTGITQPVPLHLTKGGVVTMQGGDVQTMSIKPSEVQPNGTFTTTRTITGIQAGVWEATATVVVFDVCLQDDNNGNSIMLSRNTGDYIFCPGRSSQVGSSPISLTTLGVGGAVSHGLALRAPNVADSSLIIIPPVFTFEYNGPDRQLVVNLDWVHFPAAGSATVQTAKPVQKFTITDRDTRNNVCPCQ